MRNLLKNVTPLLIILLIVVSCGPKRERFNYTLIKSKMENLTETQIDEFDDIAAEYLSKARAVFHNNQGGDKEKVMQEVNSIWVEQDAKIKEILSEEQFAVYATEIKIEREGREKYNTTLIRDELGLDSAQLVQYNLANEAFYKLLIDNHDNYHGKPDVYLEYYAEIDISRKEAFSQLMTDEQYTKYLELAEKYKLGKSEAY